MDTKNFNVTELSTLEIQSIEGGDWIAYALGSIYGAGKAIIDGYASALSGMGVYACDAAMMSM